MQTEELTENIKELSRLIYRSNPILVYSDILLNHSLKDDLGGNRRVALIVVNPTKGLYLPIEIAKSSGSARWKVSSKQGGTLKAQFGMVLKVTARQIKDEPDTVVAEVNRLLQLQSSSMLAERVKESKRNGSSSGTVRNAITNKVVMTNDVEQLKKDIYEPPTEEGLIKRITRKIRR
ncbi:hypothetical protein L3Q72_19720 [Vibrio sp. JC009]|uniref:hypothetical protein n=1 Tax=Vibrio sp. JC009 TaxID=2912314 RepID=UPI0023AF08D5|nr:hypothetical protein [Vibrio sp. JC009]WED23471.1 hypothetical protein L3Q72_19720 [Vibrio sp. JC009]